MKNVVFPFVKLLGLLFSGVMFVLGIYVFGYNYVYDSINISKVNTAIIEYGSAEYNVENFIDSVDGNIISVKNEIDSRQVGVQEVIFVVEKNGITREFPIEVEVKDTLAPEITLVSDTITLKQGNTPDLFKNIQSVVDSVDGNINYSSESAENSNNYYRIESNVNKNVPGIYAVNVYAVDKNGNSSSKSFDVVIEKNTIQDQVVNLAYSLLGKPYVLGTNGPDAFDCSGLVQYVYAQVGISVSRSSSTQYYDGVSVQYSEILPGDIINWGYSNSFSTHSGIYVGNGKMIHAANPSQGVILSDVAAWDRGSFENVIGVRRVS